MDHHIELQSLLGKDGPFTIVGHRAGVDVLQREYTPTIELAAVGEIDAAAAEVHDMLLAHVDPRIIAPLAESWIGAPRPPTRRLRDGLEIPVTRDREFTFSARWTTSSPLSLHFHVRDNRGANRRARNWVDHVLGSWRLEPLDDDMLSTRAIYHARIEFASEVPRWSIRTGALQDLPTLVEHLRSLVGDDFLPAAAANAR